MDLPAGFELAAVLEREDPRDAFVSTAFRLARRRCRRARRSAPRACAASSNCGALRPDLRRRAAAWQPRHAPAQARRRPVRRHRAGRCRADAARARAAHPRALRAEQMLPCAGQGALGIEVRTAMRSALRERLATLIRPPDLAGRAGRARGVARARRQLQHAAGGARPLGGRHAACCSGARPCAAAAARRCCARRAQDRGRTKTPQARALGEQAAAALRTLGAAGYLETAA